MRDYAKLAPTFWTGTTGKALKRRGSEGVIVALYLVSSPHSNMLGLFYQPVMYMAHETGLGIEGASKGLQDCIEAGFCTYDIDTEMVFVREMAAWQIAESLSSGDKRCKGIQKDYEALPDCPFLGDWFDRYATAFQLKGRRSSGNEKQEVRKGASQAPSKPHRSQEQEQEQEQKKRPTRASAVPPPPARPPDPDPDTSGHQPTPAGLVCRAMKAAGLQAVNPGDPRLLALLDQGATEAEFVGIAEEAVAKAKGFAWVLAVLQSRRAEAAEIALAPPTGPDPDAWRSSRSEVINRGLQLGLGPWNEVDAYNRTGPSWPQYRADVFAAVETRERSPA